MPSHAVDVPRDTPEKVRHSFGDIVRRLNAQWGLELPSIHGTQETALKQADAEHSLAKRCAGQIRYLCFRDCNLDKVISDFEEDVPRICSEWVWKPSQEQGTLPQMPVTKSFISSRPALSRKHRQPLLDRLFVLLDEECKLARESDVYKRTSFTTTDDTAADAQRNHREIITSDSVLQAVAPKFKQQAVETTIIDTEKGRSQTRRSRDTVKRKSSGSEKSAIASKKQMTLPQMGTFRQIRKPFGDVANFKPMVEPSISRQTDSNAQSFGSTMVSNAPTEIFTPVITSRNAPSDSAATSYGEETKNSSPDLFPTQDMTDIEADEMFKISFEMLCEPTKADALFKRLCDQTPFKKADSPLPHSLTFQHRFELERVADALHTSPKELLSDLTRERISSADDYDAFWAAIRSIAKERDLHPPERSSSSAWKSASDNFFESETKKRSVYLAGTLNFKSKVDEGLFDFSLKPLYLDKSCRFHRKYGPSRFMVLSIPSTSISADTPSKLKQDARSGALTESVARWVATEHRFLGRRWRAFFLEPEKKRSKTNTQAPRYRVHLFAVSGEDPSAGSVVGLEQFLGWHIPIERNLKSTNLKLFQRLSLGLSKTTSTFPLKVTEFIRLPDPVNHVVMNDGCARMSMTLAKDIARHVGLSDVPSVFQGRIAGAKGLWMAVPDHEFHHVGERNYCIEIADSQLKINPHPKDNPTADEAQRTFEVLNHSGPGKPAALNTQLLTILYDRGVPRGTLGEFLVADIDTFHRDLEESMRRPLGLRSWVQSSRLHSRGEGDIRMTGSWPDDTEEQTILLVENGFTPQSTPILLECLRSILKNHLSRYVERLLIRIPCSTYLYCIADPYGILEPHEVHLSFSEVWKDPVSGFKESFVDERDILVARLPALLPSDIQRRKAVWKRELHHLKDVIIFSTKGDMPLAHMLSGGDYDGDTPWICWDLNIVKHFENADLPKMPSKRDCGLVSHSRKVKDVFAGGTSREQLASQTDHFFAGCFEFNLNVSYLGACTTEHEKVVYFGDDLSAPDAIKLATLSGYLVDSAKQGDFLPTAKWQELRNRVSPHFRESPAYKNENCQIHMRESNVNDYLKFWRAVPQKERILTLFNKHWPQQISKDNTLSEPWTWMRNFEKGMESTAELKRILDQLAKDVGQIVDDCARQRPKDSKWATGQFRHSIENACGQFRAIKPSGFDQRFSHSWAAEGGNRFGHWPLLRASCLYSKFTAGTTAWYIAGKELCHIKAQADPHGYRTVVMNIYPVLKCDSKVAKRTQQRLDDVDPDDETFGLEDMDEEAPLPCRYRERFSTVDHVTEAQEQSKASHVTRETLNLTIAEQRSRSTSIAPTVVQRISMESRQPAAYQTGPPPFSAAQMTSQKLAMDLDYEDGRRNRAASVLSGMSQEDMEAAETLNSLQLEAHYHSPPQQPPTLIQSQTTYSPNEQPEPLFSLLTSQYPLTASMINRSLSVYRGTQSLIPGAYTVEQNLGLPLASMLGRVTGVQGGIRWALQPRRRDSNDGSISKPQKADIEAGMGQYRRDGRHTRRGSGMSEQLPAYDDAGRSPPYQEQQLVPHTRDGQTPPGWRAQLMISTSGLGIAMSEESLRSLRYCLSWLRWANERLGGVVLSLNDVLKRWEEGQQQDIMAESALAHDEKPSQAALAAKVQELKGVVLQTLKQVVEVISNYAGGALPENARNLVHRHITSLPLRFRVALSMSSDENGGNASAHKVMMLAQEGLNMMGQVSGVVNYTLVSAESWCEKLGRRQGQQQQQQQQQQQPVLQVEDVKMEEQSQLVEDASRESSASTLRKERVDVDIKMEG